MAYDATRAGRPESSVPHGVARLVRLKAKRGRLAPALPHRALCYAGKELAEKGLRRIAGQWQVPRPDHKTASCAALRREICARCGTCGARCVCVAPWESRHYSARDTATSVRP